MVRIKEMGFQHAKAKAYAKVLVNYLGRPSYSTPVSLIWERVGPYERIVLVDEEIKHTSPFSHHDFVYTTIKVPSLTQAKACQLLRVSDSIIVDLLKKEVTARCGALIKNDVTLSYVLDIVSGKARPNKREYERRIRENVVSVKRLTFGRKIDLKEGSKRNRRSSPDRKR